MEQARGSAVRGALGKQLRQYPERGFGLEPSIAPPGDERRKEGSVDTATLWGFILPNQRLGFMKTGSAFLKYQQHNAAPGISVLSTDSLSQRQSQCGHHS